MNRRSFLLTIPIAICWTFGCGSSSRKPAGALTKAELEAMIQDRQKWATVELTEESKRQFVGTGTGTDGVKYNLKVSQGDNEIRWEWNDEGGRGQGNASERWSGN